MTPSRIRGRRPPADPDRSAAPDTEHPAPGPGDEGDGRIREEELRRHRDAWFREFAESLPQTVYEIDPEGTILYANRHGYAMFGREGEPHGPLNAFDFLVPEERARVRENMGRLARGEKESGTEYLFRRADGSRFPAILHAVPVPDGQGGLRFRGMIIDISEQKRAERELREARDELLRVSRRDPLTGLPNRRHLFERLREALRTARRRDEGLALLFLDLDGFKEINDGRGHAAGDAALRTAAGRIRRAARGEDLVARFGGDEFVVLLRGVADRTSAERIARRIEGALAAPLGTRGRAPAGLGASWGLTLFPADGADADTLLRVADARMYEAKRRRKAGLPPTGDGEGAGDGEGVADGVSPSGPAGTSGED